MVECDSHKAGVRLPLLLRGGEGWGEEAFVMSSPDRAMTDRKTHLLSPALSSIRMEEREFKLHRSGGVRGIRAFEVRSRPD